MDSQDLYSCNDREVLRQLAGQWAVAADDPVNDERAKLWTCLNDRRSQRPMVWITEAPWHEFADEPELALSCERPWARGMEQNFRRTLYRWRHFPVDMVISRYLSCPIVFHSTGFGMVEETDIVRTDPHSDIVSRQYHRQIVEPEDIEKIQMPQVTRDDATTEAHFNAMAKLFAEILPVRKTGIKNVGYSPWDYLITVWGVEEALMDLVLRPEMVHAAVDRVVAGYMTEYDQIEALGLLDNGNDNTRTGSGGYGYTTDLPPFDFNTAHVRAKDTWGFATAQIFSAVSPEMLWEFAIEHDLPFMRRWGLNYYGCCEPLDRMVEVLRHIPNLRKVSMSPLADMGRAAKEFGTDFVLSHKPNPAQVAVDDWSIDRARKVLVDTLDVSQGCHVEVIFKDISTVRRQPRRLWEWGQMAMQVVCEMGESSQPPKSRQVFVLSPPASR